MLSLHLLAVGYLCASGLTAAVAWRTYRYRPVPGARSFGIGMAAVAGWATLSAMAHMGPFRGTVPYSFLIRAEWIAIGVLGVAWLAFALSYTGRDQYVTRGRLAALSVVPAVTAVVALSHPLVLPTYADLLGPAGGLVALLRPLSEFWDGVELLGTVYLYGLVAAGSLLVLEVLLERRITHVGQALLVLVVGPPWILNALYIGDVVRFATFDPTVLGFTISGLAGLFAVGRFQLFEVPLGRSRIVEDLDSGVLVVGRHGAVYDFNEAAVRMLGCEPATLEADVREVLEESALEVSPSGEFDPETDPETDPNGQFAPETGDEGDTAARDEQPSARGQPTPDGGVGTLSEALDGRTVAAGDEAGAEFVELRVSTLGDVTGKPLSRTLLLYDVTERERRKRELERKNELLDEFAGVVSHDVASPLGIVENRVHLARETGDPSHLEEIPAATGRIRNLVDDLRELARQGRAVGETDPVDVEEVVRDAWRSVSDRNATLTVEGTRTVAADRERLRQLVENLLGNAVEHGSTSSPSSSTRENAVEHGSTSPPSSSTREDAVEHGSDGSGPVRITVGCHPDGFYVADDGSGVPDGVRERIFERGVSTADGGTGLGLTIVRRIADAHGWEVTATESEEGGAQFDVRTGS